LDKEFPYRLEYRNVGGQRVAYVVYVPTGVAGRASQEEEAMMLEIERLKGVCHDDDSNQGRIENPQPW
jgi:hypothetical protein